MSSQILRSPLPYLALILAHLIWGANFVVGKVALQEFPVMSLSYLRFSLAIILLIPFLYALDKKDLRINPKDLPKLFILGLTMVTLSIAFFYEGLQRTTAINASALTMTVPIISVVIGWLFLKEKIFWVNLLGILFGLSGAVVILQLPLLIIGNFTTESLLGNILIILSGVSFVIGTIFAKRFLNKYQIVVITAILFSIGSVTFLVPALKDYLDNPTWFYDVTLLGILSLMYITLLSSVSAFFLLEWGLKRMGLFQAHLFQYIEPAIAATLAVPLLGERISFSFIIGTCLVILGVYCGTLGRPHHHHLRHKHHRS